jgi:hypothetical protein
VAGVMRSRAVVERFRGDRHDVGAGAGREVRCEIEVGGDQVVAVNQIGPTGNRFRDGGGMRPKLGLDNSA